MKVCFVTTSFIRGPRDYYSRFVFEQARSILAADARAEVTVVAPHAEGLARRETIDGIEIRRFRYFWPARMQRLAYRNEGLFSTLRTSFLAKLNLPCFLGSMLWSLWRASKHADVIHAQWLPTALVARVVGRLRRIPVVASIRGADINTMSNSRLGRRLACSILRRVDHVITVSDEFCQRLHDIPCVTPIEAVYNGIDDAQFKPCSQADSKRTLGLAEDQRHILYLGGLIQRKRVDTLLQAFSGVLRRHENVRLCIAGEGPSEQELKQLAGRLEIAGRVSFVGAVPRDQSHLWLAAAEMLVLPSESEGRPNVVLEAMACQRPVIATDVNGTVELIEHGVNGLLFEPGDHDQLTSLMLRVLKDSVGAKGMAARGAQFIEQRGLTWNSHGKKLRQIYKQVAKSYAGGRLAGAVARTADQLAARTSKLKARGAR